jgi:two-component system, NtrC family, response regulator GlrR
MKTQPPARPISLGFGIQPKGKPDAAAEQDSPSASLKPKILVVDADPALRRLTIARLGTAKYAVDNAASAESALSACVRSRPNLVVAELRLPDMDGVAFLKELKSRWPQLIVIVLTAHGSISEAVHATQAGAFGYLVKPVERDELLGQVERAIATSTFAFTQGDWRSCIVARSELMQQRLSIANQAAAGTMPVLLTGENGTGKELLARAIHAASERRKNSFVGLRCTNLSEAELEVELFGGEPGDAHDEDASKPGAFRLAHRGTLLLEDIGNLSTRLQLALSRVLRREVLPSAETCMHEAARMDVRLICTTSHDLEAARNAGEFLDSLYRLISVLSIEIPPLGRRREDIPLLVSHFLEQARHPGSQKKIYTPDAIELLSTADWPGNVRQLFELVKENVALSRGKLITREIVQQSIGETQNRIPTYDEAREQFAREYLSRNLERTAGNVSQAARIAKRNRADFYKLLSRYRLHPEDFKNAARRRRKSRRDGGKSGE